MKLINLTPHSINIYHNDELICSLEPSGTVARVKSEKVTVGVVNINGYDVNIVKTVFGDLEGLPEPEEGTIFVLSTIAAQAAVSAGRTDVVSPDTFDGVIRDAQGKIIGVRQLQTF